MVVLGNITKCHLQQNLIHLQNVQSSDYMIFRCIFDRNECDKLVGSNRSPASITHCIFVDNSPDSESVLLDLPAVSIITYSYFENNKHLKFCAVDDYQTAKLGGKNNGFEIVNEYHRDSYPDYAKCHMTNNLPPYAVTPRPQNYDYGEDEEPENRTTLYVVIGCSVAVTGIIITLAVLYAKGVFRRCRHQEEGIGEDYGKNDGRTDEIRSDALLQSEDV